MQQLHGKETIESYVPSTEDQLSGVVWMTLVRRHPERPEEARVSGAYGVFSYRVPILTGKIWQLYCLALTLLFRHFVMHCVFPRTLRQSFQHKLREVGDERAGMF